MKTIFLLVFLVTSSRTTAQIASRYDVIIDEIFADPSPAQALPAAEFIELKNNSSYPFNMNGWKLSDGNTTATITT
jgi:hypothetical protein